MVVIKGSEKVKLYRKSVDNVKVWRYNCINVDCIN